jgi:hypothetical protein
VPTAFVTVLGLGRIVLGLVSIFGIAPAVRLLGVPPAHDTPTARLFARLFGVRDIGLGVLVLWSLERPGVLPFVLLFNAAHDLADALMIAVPLVRRQGIDRTAGLSLAFALGGLSLWLVAWSRL